ncbi:hypothetical protein BGX28_001315 [Mortierella sp. GBA30]|nr:hypothetical protein BGX28_001315 [Mortierella sp. GBA30]
MKKSIVLSLGKALSLLALFSAIGHASEFKVPEEITIGTETTIEWVGKPSLGTSQQAVVLFKNDEALVTLCQGLISGSGQCSFTLSEDDAKLSERGNNNGYHLGLQGEDGVTLDISKDFAIHSADQKNNEEQEDRNNGGQGEKEDRGKKMKDNQEKKKEHGKKNNEEKHKEQENEEKHKEEENKEKQEHKHEDQFEEENVQEAKDRGNHDNDDEEARKRDDSAKEEGYHAHLHHHHLRTPSVTDEPNFQTITSQWPMYTTDVTTANSQASATATSDITANATPCISVTIALESIFTSENPTSSVTAASTTQPLVVPSPQHETEARNRYSNHKDEEHNVGHKKDQKDGEDKNVENNDEDPADVEEDSWAQIVRGVSSFSKNIGSMFSTGISKMKHLVFGEPEESHTKEKSHHKEDRKDL